jgi:hypothetical protein
LYQEIVAHFLLHSVAKILLIHSASRIKAYRHRSIVQEAHNFSGDNFWMPPEADKKCKDGQGFTESSQECGEMIVCTVFDFIYTFIYSGQGFQHTSPGS